LQLNDDANISLFAVSCWKADLARLETRFEAMSLQNQQLVLAQSPVNQIQPAPGLSIPVGSEASAHLLLLHSLPVIYNYTNTVKP
jgi:hypothetical protein